MIRALWAVPLILAAACGGSSGVAGPGRDAGREAMATDAPGDSPGAFDVPPEAPSAADAADVVSERGPDGVALVDANGDALSDATGDAHDAPASDAVDAVATTDAPAEAAPADAAADRTDAPSEPVPMACTAPGSCDPFDPQACGAQLCRVQGDGNASCVTGAATLKALGATCAGTTECGDGLDCVRIGDDPGFTCQRMCPKGSIGFCGADARCTSFFTGCVQFCRPRDPPCDVYAQNCVDPARACAPTVDTETGERYTGCRRAGPGARGDRCETAACGKGLVCVRDAGISTCRQICTGDGGALPCAAGETCAGVTSTYQITYCK